MNKMIIPFCRPFVAGTEVSYIQEALSLVQNGEAGMFSRRCETILKQLTQAFDVLLTHSCTNALELAATLVDISPGDEVILPSFTFSSTANAFALRGAKIVFVDVRPDTLNINEAVIESAITTKTRVIVPVHYAGVGCAMHEIMTIADQYNLLVVEDAAQCIGAEYKGRALGAIGHMGAYSFHSTKNLSCGEGGALLVNDERFQQRAEILHDKGTNRAQYRAGHVRQYEWVDLGMSAPPTELQAACLLAQLENLDLITKQRLAIWRNYARVLMPLSRLGAFRLLAPPPECNHNGHIFALIFNSSEQRDKAQHALAQQGIQTALHYQPLHLSPAGKKIGVSRGKMTVSESIPSHMLRLPIWPGMPLNTCERIAGVLHETLA
jgi:dTDP-4-amino-4,6-dideoxygalactose transaminase